MKLFIKDAEVKVGMAVKTFRGEPAVVRGTHLPHKPSSTGRVDLEFPDGSFGQYFPGVINAEWRNDDAL